MKDRGNALREDSPRHPWRVEITPKEFRDNWKRTFGTSKHDRFDKDSDDSDLTVKSE